MTQTLSIADQHLVLHPSGSIYWQEADMLIIADVHLGKAAHFRKHGSAVPTAVSEANFLKLDEVISHFNPKQICFLGDLFHSHRNSDWERFEEWVQNCPSALILITGNHDIISAHKFEALGIEVFEEQVYGPFLCTHYPTENPDHFNLAGHIHPGVRLAGTGRQQLRLPCFFKQQYGMVVPAFGTFTGKHIITPEEGDQIFAIADGEVIPISQ